MNNNHYKYADLHYTKTTPKGLMPAGPVTLSTRLILAEADDLGVKWKIIPGTKIIELHYQNKIKYFRYQISTETTDVGFYGCLDKSVTNSLLMNEGIEVPHGYYISPSEPESYWQEIYEALAKPLVIKPTTGNQGQSISLGIDTFEQYLAAVKKALSFSNDKDAGAIVEEQFEGKEYRILATRQKVLGIIYRMPANVLGDGQHTIAELIEEKNSDPRRFDDPNESLVKIKINDEVMAYLADQKMKLSDVPLANQRVFLRRNSNISTGGDSYDVTDEAHSSVKELAVQAVQAVPGLDFAGVDFMTTDIEAVQTKDTYRIIEINSSPGFSIHEYAYQGKPRNSEKEFLYLAFPELRPV